MVGWVDVCGGLCTHVCGGILWAFVVWWYLRIVVVVSHGL